MLSGLKKELRKLGNAERAKILSGFVKNHRQRPVSCYINLLCSVVFEHAQNSTSSEIRMRLHQSKNGGILTFQDREGRVW